MREISAKLCTQTPLSCTNRRRSPGCSGPWAGATVASWPELSSVGDGRAWRGMGQTVGFCQFLECVPLSLGWGGGGGYVGQSGSVCALSIFLRVRAGCPSLRGSWQWELVGLLWSVSPQGTGSHPACPLQPACGDLLVHCPLTNLTFLPLETGTHTRGFPGVGGSGCLCSSRAGTGGH